MQSGNREPGGFYAVPTGVLHGDPLRVRDFWEQSRRPGARRGPSHPHHLHAKQIRYGSIEMESMGIPARF